MASDRQQFDRAFEHWNTLFEAGNFSVPVEEGRTAIISSPFTDDDPNTPSGESELVAFRSEALAIADRIAISGGLPELAIDATKADITSIIKNPEVVNIFSIGNGSLSALILDIDERYDWVEAARETDHLKSGVFIQRHCGGLTRALNVPFGQFVVSDFRNLLAPVDVEFYPRSLKDPENRKIQRIFGSPTVTYLGIKALQSSVYTFASGNLTSAEAQQRAKSIDALVKLAESFQSDTEPKNTNGSNEASSIVRGNFYNRLIDLQAVQNETATPEQINYVRMVKERFGLDLIDVINENAELFQEIYPMLRRKSALDKLQSGLLDVGIYESTGLVKHGSVDRIIAAAGGAAGLKSIETHVNGGLNPLLEEVYRKIDLISLNAPFLTR